MRSSEPRISVVVPVRDRAEQLARCLDSLAAQDLSSEEYEVIVCDDGSIGDLSGAVGNIRTRALHIRLLKQDRRGPAAARNLGIRGSSAPIVVFIDSDIVADGALIGRLARSLAENPDWAGAEASLLPIEGSRSPLWEAPDAAAGGRFHTAAIAYRREALLAAGGLDETFLLPACEDVELAARILRLGPIGFVSDAIAYHPRRRIGIRVHWNSRLHWKYLVILANRYQFLAFPDRRIGRCPRVRIALAAVVNLPLGRLVRAMRWLGRSPLEAAIAAALALFDILCGLWALPEILFCSVPARTDYIGRGTPSGLPVNELPSECRP